MIDNILNENTPEVEAYREAMKRGEIILLLQRTIDHQDPDRQYIGYLADKISELIEQQVLIGQKEILARIGEPTLGDFNVDYKSYDDVIKCIKWYKDQIAELDRQISKLTGEKK